MSHHVYVVFLSEMGPCCQLALRDFVSGRLVQLGSTVEQTEAELARREQVAAEKKRAEEMEEARAQGRRESKNKYKVSHMTRLSA